MVMVMVMGNSRKKGHIGTFLSRQQTPSPPGPWVSHAGKRAVMGVEESVSAKKIKRSPQGKASKQANFCDDLPLGKKKKKKGSKAVVAIDQTEIDRHADLRYRIKLTWLPQDQGNEYVRKRSRQKKNSN